MGSIVSLFTSFRMIMGVPLLGSIISPRILTSISILTRPRILYFSRKFAVKAVRLRLSDAHSHDLTRQLGRPAEVHDLVARAVPSQVARRPRALPLDQHTHLRADVRLINLTLYEIGRASCRERV